ncbi:DUF1493 family protein [Hymenobacter sp. DG01]|uniref:DUF1493 family protein n=1 Tax=Hymenobacter sp. DG01 TaxID=2584940 RepID=UPI001124866F|nr:DUF1493 family protein [Hymenobacter sp. DG01]
MNNSSHSSTIAAVRCFLSEEIGANEAEITGSADLVNDLGVWGDDFFELMEKFSQKFQVNITSFRWYFHSGEEGFNTGGIIFRPPNERVEHIPVTLEMLAEAAEKQRWIVEYPPHRLPAHRFDIWLNLLLALGIVLALLFKFLVM